MRPPRTSEQLEKRRRRAVQLLESGRTLAAVARQVGATASSVFRWRVAYVADLVDLYRETAGYVDRILKVRSRPSFPSSSRTKFELVIRPRDRQGARRDGPAIAVRRADHVIE